MPKGIPGSRVEKPCEVRTGRGGYEEDRRPSTEVADAIGNLTYKAVLITECAGVRAIWRTQVNPSYAGARAKMVRGQRTRWRVVGRGPNRER